MGTVICAGGMKYVEVTQHTVSAYSPCAPVKSFGIQQLIGFPTSCRDSTIAVKNMRRLTVYVWLTRSTKSSSGQDLSAETDDPALEIPSRIRGSIITHEALSASVVSWCTNAC